LQDVSILSLKNIQYTNDGNNEIRIEGVLLIYKKLVAITLY